MFALLPLLILLLFPGLHLVLLFFVLALLRLPLADVRSQHPDSSEPVL